MYFGYRSKSKDSTCGGIDVVEGFDPACIASRKDVAPAPECPDRNGNRNQEQTEQPDGLASLSRLILYETRLVLDTAD